MRRLTTAVMAVALVGGLTACDDDALGPDDQGQVEAFVGDSDPDMAMLTSGSSGFEGTAAGDFQVSISADGASWVDLGSLNGITVALRSSGNRTTVHGQQSVPVGTYAHVRLALSNVELEVKAGSSVGGVTLESDVQIQIAADQQLVIERQVQPFTVSASAGAEVEFDLASQVWLTEEAVQAEVVSEAAVAASITAAVLAQ